MEMSKLVPVLREEIPLGCEDLCTWLAERPSGAVD